jgi:hypothetical protein
LISGPVQGTQSHKQPAPASSWGEGSYLRNRIMVWWSLPARLRGRWTLDCQGGRGPSSMGNLAHEFNLSCSSVMSASLNLCVSPSIETSLHLPTPWGFLHASLTAAAAAAAAAAVAIACALLLLLLLALCCSVLYYRPVCYCISKSHPSAASPSPARRVFNVHSLSWRISGVEDSPYLSQPSPTLRWKPRGVCLPSLCPSPLTRSTRRC